jgi:hypothetical protein
MINSRRMRWVGYVAHMGVFGKKNLNKRNHFQYLCIEGKIILKWIFKNMGRVWTGFISLRIGTSSKLF